ncbi:hypothetical protein R2A130_1296 [Ahrensia sp. R2A130]|nr:hypothetical protein R2A130_1296 [Ahrensia sp. R2A130]
MATPDQITTLALLGFLLSAACAVVWKISERHIAVGKIGTASELLRSTHQISGVLAVFFAGLALMLIVAYSLFRTELLCDLTRSCGNSVRL